MHHYACFTKAKRGLIVKKEWVLDSYVKKRRLPASKLVYVTGVHIHVHVERLSYSVCSAWSSDSFLHVYNACTVHVHVLIGS